MIKVTGPIFDTTKQTETNFTFLDFSRGGLKIVPTQDGKCHLATDVILGYKDGVLCSKTLKILVDEIGLAYMNAPEERAQDFKDEECFVSIPNNVINVGGGAYYSNSIFGFDLEHHVCSKYIPEESVLKFYAVAPNMYGEILGRKSDEFLNAKAVGYIAKYINSHQKEINQRLAKISETALLAPTEAFLNLEEKYMDALKKYTEGEGSYNNLINLKAEYNKAKIHRDSSKPINFYFTKVIENENKKNKPKLFGEEE